MPKKGGQQYNINLPTDLYEELKEIADEEGTTLAVVMKKYLRLGVRTYKMASGYPKTVLISDPTGENEAIFVL